jgi:predicted permease
MRHPLHWLLRFGRSDADRLSLIGDLEEEHRARRAAGAGRAAVFAWETREIVAACLYAIRDARPGARLRLTADVRYALRRWRRRPGFAATAILTIALGIAAATSIFSVVDAVLLRPLRWHAPESLVVVHGVYPERRDSPATAPTWDRWYLSYPAWDALRTSPAFAAVGAWRHLSRPDTTFGEDRTEIITTLEVSSNFLPMLGVRTVLGRYFTETEDNVSTDSVLLSHEIWQRRFGGREDVLNTRVMLGSASSGGRYPKTIVGVVEPGFSFGGIQPDVLLPVGIPAATLRKYPSAALRVVARLAPGVSAMEAQAHAEALVSEAPNSTRGSARVVRLDDDQLAASRRPLWLLFGGAALLLLVACSNVAGLLVGEARVRRHEIGVRAALGGSRARVLCQLIVEHSLLAAAGLLAGLIGAWWFTGALVAAAPAGLPRIETTAIDLRAALFAAGAALTTLIGFGIAPAIALARTPMTTVLAEGGRDGAASRLRGQRLIVAAQIALALVLVTGAALFGETMLQLRAQPLGFDPKGVAVVSTTFTGSRFGDPAAAAAAFASRDGAGRMLDRLRTDTTLARTRAVVDRLTAIPAVTSAAAATAVPFVSPPARLSIGIDGAPASERPEVLRYAVTAGYLETMDIRLVRGAGLRDAAAGDANAAVVSATFERRFFPGGAIGQRFSNAFGDNDAAVIPYRIVGVVPDVKRQDPTDEDRPAFYSLIGHRIAQVRPGAPVSTASGTPGFFVVRASDDPAWLLPALRQAIAGVSPQLVVTSMTTLETQVGDAVVEERFRATLSAIFGAAALGLAAVGLYGLAARRVVDRRREFGVRVALGARPRDVRRLVLRDAVVIVAIGLLIGLPSAFAAAQLAESLLFGVSASSVSVFGMAALVLALAAFTATLLPARHAGRVDPVTALRE